jgi:hypothetical protein
MSDKQPTEREIQLAREWSNRPLDNPNFKLAVARLLAEYRCELMRKASESK